MTLALEWENAAGEDRVFVFDAVISELHGKTAELAKHSVEGKPMADHVIEGADTIAIEGMVSATPVTRILPTGGEIIDAIGGDDIATGDISAITFESDASSVDRQADAIEVLYSLTGSPTLVTVVASEALRVYDNMILIGIAVTRDQAGGSARVSIDLEQARIVETATAVVTVPQEPRGNAAVESGVAETETEEGGALDDPDSDDRSWLAQIADAF